MAPDERRRYHSCMINLGPMRSTLYEMALASLVELIHTRAKPSLIAAMRLEVASLREQARDNA